MHVGMEKAIAQRVAQERLDKRVCKAVEIMSGSAQRIDIGHLDAIDPLHGDDVATGALPIDFRDAEAFVACGVLCNFRQCRGFQPEVHLDPGRLLQRLRHLDRAQPPARGDEPFLQACHQIHDGDIVGEALAHARPYDLDRHLAKAIGRPHLGRVHLCDRGCGNRFADAGIEIVERPAQRAFDIGLGGGHRKERHAVLKLRKVIGKFDTDDIRPRCQELADFRIGRSEPLDCLRKPVAARLGFRAAAGKQRHEGLGEADRWRQAFGG